MNVLAVGGMKGGVGKTATAVNLAAAAGQNGWRVLLCDLDPQGAATFCVGAAPPEQHPLLRRRPHKSLVDAITSTPVPGLSVLGADTALRAFERAPRRASRDLTRVLAPLRPHIDLVVFDSPPGLTTTLDHLLRVSDVLLLPTEPAPLPIRATQTLVDYAASRPMAGALWGVWSMVDERKPLHRRTLRTSPDGLPFFSAQIPMSSAVERMAEHRAPAVTASPQSLAARRYHDLFAEVAELVALRR